ncbi:hypothetical protein D3C87_1578280 [compost metagenome]
MLAAISSMAAEVCSALEACTEVVWPSLTLEVRIRSALSPTCSALAWIRPVMARRLSIIEAIALPNWSRSPLGFRLRLRSPRLMASAIPATSLR